MHVQHSVYLKGESKALGEALFAGPKWWFPRLDEEGVGEVHAKVAFVEVGKKVKVEAGQAQEKGDWVVVPVRWEATFARGLFPVMEGEVDLAPSGPGMTRLSVRGMYKPPLGEAGRILDEAVMHRVAQATVKRLAEEIAAKL